jgi:hypothetical protein
VEIEKSLSKFQADVYHALKAWHQAGTEPSPLAHLQLFRDAQFEDGSNDRETTNKILLKGLADLAVDHQAEANLLRKRFLDGSAMHVVANQLNMSEANAYRRQKAALRQLAILLQAGEARARQQRLQRLEKRLAPPTYVQLIGVEACLADLLDLLIAPRPPWLVSIEGLGGIGKTSLADALSRRIIRQGFFSDFGWVSARQQVLNLGGGIKPVAVPALTAEDLVEKLAAQLMPAAAPSAPLSFEEALTTLRTRLKQTPHLIVIDNLETIADLESLLPTLRNLVEPTKFLLTSRKSLYHESGVYHFTLPGLSETHALRLIRHEAELHNLPHLQQASDADLRKIFDLAGGNPLALRLVVGQTHMHALDVVLDDLASARGQTVETLYTFIYRRAWDALPEPAGQVFLAMPLVTNQGGSLAYLADLVDLAPGQIRDALDQLVALNLVNSTGDLAERRYTIHNLTRTFLQEQVAKWQ